MRDAKAGPRRADDGLRRHPARPEDRDLVVPDRHGVPLVRPAEIGDADEVRSRDVDGRAVDVREARRDLDGPDRVGGNHRAAWRRRACRGSDRPASCRCWSGTWGPRSSRSRAGSRSRPRAARIRRNTSSRSRRRRGRRATTTGRRPARPRIRRPATRGSAARPCAGRDPARAAGRRHRRAPRRRGSGRASGSPRRSAGTPPPPPWAGSRGCPGPSRWRSPAVGPVWRPCRMASRAPCGVARS